MCFLLQLRIRAVPILSQSPYSLPSRNSSSLRDFNTTCIRTKLLNQFIIFSWKSFAYIPTNCETNWQPRLCGGKLTRVNTDHWLAKTLIILVLFVLWPTGSFQRYFMLTLVCPFLEMTLVPETGEIYLLFFSFRLVFMRQFFPRLIINLWWKRNSQHEWDDAP